MTDQHNLVVVHFAKGSADPEYFAFGEGVRLYVVDENALGDRVYEITRRSEPAKLEELVPEGSAIGHAGDERHPAIAAKIKAYLEGRPHHLRVVDGRDAG